MAAKYVGASRVGIWLGKSRSAVWRYRQHEHSPKPDTYIRGAAHWLPQREADWRKWFATYGPGRSDALRGMSSTARRKKAKEISGKYKAGASVRALTAEYGHSYGTIHAMLGEAGTKMRGRGGATSRRSPSPDGSGRARTASRKA